jgi:hypothetical protein
MSLSGLQGSSRNGRCRVAPKGLKDVRSWDLSRVDFCQFVFRFEEEIAVGHCQHLNHVGELGTSQESLL